jgi:glycosyltransferase involved in cell wall biosynthesis
MIRVDIILISYNQESYIRQAVESILIQQVSEGVDVKVIIADDGSDDNTLSIIAEYEKSSCFPFNYLPRENNMGMQRNYQRAFAACQGDYVFILEGDDYWCSPNHIMQHVLFLEQHLECSMSVNGIVLLWQQMSLFEMNPKECETDVVYVNLQQQIEGNHIGNFSATCLRTKLLGCFPSQMYNLEFADWLVGIIMSQYGFIALLQDYTSVYRKHSNGQWSGLDDQSQKNEIITAYDTYNELLGFKYDVFFENAKKKLRPTNKKKNIHLVDILPYGIIKFGKYLLPKSLHRSIKGY